MGGEGDAAVSLPRGHLRRAHIDAGALGRVLSRALHNVRCGCPTRERLSNRAAPQLSWGPCLMPAQALALTILQPLPEPGRVGVSSGCKESLLGLADWPASSTQEPLNWEAILSSVEK